MKDEDVTDGWVDQITERWPDDRWLQDSGEANGGQLLNGGKPRPKAEINQSRLEEETEVKLAIRGGI